MPGTGARRVFVSSYASPAGPAGITCYDFDARDGTLTERYHADAPNPGFLSVDRERDILFAEYEDPERRAGHVASYAIEPDGLRPLTHQTLGDPCHLAPSPSGRHLVVCCHHDGKIAVVPVSPDGSLREPTDVVTHSGHGPRPTQLGPFPHCATFDPSGRFAAVADAGNDTVTAYQLDEQAGRLIAQHRSVLSLPPGTEPRHIVFHPLGHLAYVNGEASMSLTALRFDAERGTFTELSRVGLVSGNLSGPPAGRRLASAELIVDRAARRLYVSNRGSDNISVLAVDGDAARPRLAAQFGSGGLDPRHIALSPCERFLYVANQGSACVVQFAVDGETGNLQATGHSVRAPAPTCIAFG